jgi:histone deacetylase complex regulatory component SIN3
MIVMTLRGEGPEKSAPSNKEKPPATETAPSTPPSAPGAKQVTEERNIMAITPPTMTAPERGNLRGNGHNPPQTGVETRSAFQTAIEGIDKIKVCLRDVIGDLNDAVTLLKTTERDQRAAAKEVQTVRAKLKEIQSVEI